MTTALTQGKGTTRATASQARRDGSLLVAEVFGPTFQGEGTSAGCLAAFVRLSRCGLACSWCDTPYTWDRTSYDLRAESRRMTQTEVWHTVKDIPAVLTVITGGEPLLQQDRLVWLADMCRATGRRVEIETSGVIAPSAGISGAAHQFNVSLKLANSGMTARRRLRPAAIRALAATRKCAWKFVATGPGDLDEIADLQQRYGLDPVWVMPEGTTGDTVLARLRELADPVLARGWNLTPRLHTLLWGDARGR
jgi:7-cyano-7-deazaguanosine (preQ0) biosynthesis protein QueE